MHSGQSAALDKDDFKGVIQDQGRQVPRGPWRLDLLIAVGRQKIQVALGVRLGLFRGVPFGNEESRRLPVFQAVFPR